MGYVILLLHSLSLPYNYLESRVVAKTKALHKLRGYITDDLRLFFAYAKTRFSHDTAHIFCFFEPFPVTNGVKQGCVMAPTLFSMMFSAMLSDAFEDVDAGFQTGTALMASY